VSNRLIQIGRVPLIPDPYVAIKGSQAFSFSRAQTERVTELRTNVLAFCQPSETVFAGLVICWKGQSRSATYRR